MPLGQDTPFALTPPSLELGLKSWRPPGFQSCLLLGSFRTVPGGMPSASRASISAAPARLRPPPHTGLPIHLLQFRIPASRPCPNLRTYASPSPESNCSDVFSFPERLEPQHVNLPNPETRTLSSAGLLHAGTTHSVPESRSVCIPSYFMKLSY